MRFRTTLLTFIFMALLALPLMAQEEGAHTVAFDGVSFSFAESVAENVNISQYPGDPVEGAGPGFSDAAHIQFTLYDVFPVPESQWDAKGGIRVYGADAIAQYDFLQAQADQLQTLLDERPDLSAFEVPLGENMVNALPYIPVLPHGQLIRARAEYIETEAVRGIGYILYTNATAEPFLSHSFSYTFQGISTDGDVYISATFPLTTTLFPAEPSSDFNYETFAANLETYLTETIAALDTAETGDFSPSLDSLDAIIESMQFTS